jgi:hypothetical protein
LAYCVANCLVGVAFLSNPSKHFIDIEGTPFYASSALADVRQIKKTGLTALSCALGTHLDSVVQRQLSLMDLARHGVAWRAAVRSEQSRPRTFRQFAGDEALLKKKSGAKVA